MELFVIIVNGFPLTIITKGSILDVPAALALHLVIFKNFKAFAKSVCFCSRLLETFCKNSTRQWKFAYNFKNSIYKEKYEHSQAEQ